MCRSRQEIIEEEPIIGEVDEHLRNNNLTLTEKMMFKLVRENHIRTIMAEEKSEDNNRYPSLTWLAMKKPLAFFPGLFAVLLLLSSFFIEETRLYMFELSGIPPVQPDHYLAVAFPLFGFLVITSIVGARK